MNPLDVVGVLLVAVGLYGVLLKRNLLKVVTGIVLMSLGVAVLVVMAGVDGGEIGHVPQTVGLIAVAGGASVASLMVVTAVRLYDRYKTLDISEIRRLKG